MDRLFITKNTARFSGMYKDTDFEESSSDISDEYTFDTLKVLVLPDTFKNWEDYNIDKGSDFILYHKSSDLQVIAAITEKFTHIEKGSHNLGDFHDKVFRIIFNKELDDKNKAESIIKLLFRPKKNTAGSQITIQEIRNAYHHLYKFLTIAFIKEKKKIPINKEMEEINYQMVILSEYFKDDSDLPIAVIQKSENKRFIGIYEFLKTYHSKIEEKLSN